MGETNDEIVAVMRDLRAVDVDILTLGQYLRPSNAHLALDRYVTPEDFRRLRDIGIGLGFRHVESGPLVRSSYHAWEQVQAAGVRASDLPFSPPRLPSAVAQRSP
jgi:lipoic acid synthetase